VGYTREVGRRNRVCTSWALSTRSLAATTAVARRAPLRWPARDRTGRRAGRWGLPVPAPRTWSAPY
jgi:hypothetical protein